MRTRDSPPRGRLECHTLPPPRYARRCCPPGTARRPGVGVHDQCHCSSTRWIERFVRGSVTSENSPRRREDRRSASSRDRSTAEWRDGSSADRRSDPLWCQRGPLGGSRRRGRPLAGHSGGRPESMVAGGRPRRVTRRRPTPARCSRGRSARPRGRHRDVVGGGCMGITPVPTNARSNGFPSRHRHVPPWRVRDPVAPAYHVACGVRRHHRSPVGESRKRGFSPRPDQKPLTGRRLVTDGYG